MNTQFDAHASITIHAPTSKVWQALTDPEIITKYMFGTKVISEWQEGSAIVWKGVWKEKPYEDKGKILKITPEKLLQVTHYSPLSGVSDTPENYHTLTYILAQVGENTTISLSQDNNANEEEQKNSQGMWEQMLASMKKVIEE